MCVWCELSHHLNVQKYLILPLKTGQNQFRHPYFAGLAISGTTNSLLDLMKATILEPKTGLWSPNHQDG